MRNITGTLEQELFDSSAYAYAILDGAAIDDLPGKLWEHNPQYKSLYRGNLAPDVAAVAPYLVRLERHHPFTVWLLENAPGQNWGIFTRSGADLQSVRRHLRRLLTVHDEEGRALLFRFYDPRVLAAYVHGCTDTGLAALFGPLDALVAQPDDEACRSAVAQK
jgi:hypothetical protein